MKINKRKIGHPHTEQAKQKIRKANLGKKLSEETKQKISKSNKGLGSKRVGKYDKNKKLVKIYNSIMEAEAENKCNNISAVCNGHRSRAAGHDWRFIDE